MLAVMCLRGPTKDLESGLTVVGLSDMEVPKIRDTLLVVSRLRTRFLWIVYLGTPIV